MLAFKFAGLGNGCSRTQTQWHTDDTDLTDLTDLH